MKIVLKNLLGFVKSILLVLNLLILPIVMIILALIKLIPIKPLQNIMRFMIYEVVSPLYININQFIIRLGSKTEWIIHQNGELNKKGWYFLMSNHRSWSDILILQSIFNGKIPMLKFFMKKELLWTLPIGGLTAWLLDFPVMHRHTKEYLKKHPEQRNKDFETTKKKCEIFKTEPVTIINFLEGTRFTEEKHKNKKSQYQHLLPPKAGGMAFTLGTMQEILHELVDVTIYYLPEDKTLWDLLCNEVDKIIVNIDVIPIPDELKGDYYHDKEFRVQFQRWLNSRWHEKDTLIDEMAKDYRLI